MSVLEEYPLDDVDLDRRINESLTTSASSMREPEDSPGVRYSKYISLDSEELRIAGHGRVLELFVESRVNGPPRSADGYELDEIVLIAGVMMKIGLGKSSTGHPRSVSQFMPEERFIGEFLDDPAAQLRAARWFAEHRRRAEFDDEVLEVVNRDFVPALDHEPDLLTKVIH